MGSVIYSELQRDLSCSLRFLPLSFSLSVVFLLIPPPSPLSNFFLLLFPTSLVSLSFYFPLPLASPLSLDFHFVFLQSARSPSCSYFSSSVCISSSPPTSPVHPLFNSRFSFLLPPLPPNFSSSLHEEGDSSEGGLDIYTGAKREEAWPRKNRRPRGEIRDDDAPGRDPATFEMPPSRVA